MAQAAPARSKLPTSHCIIDREPTRHQIARAQGLLIAAVAAILVGEAVIAAANFGPLSAFMATHITLMNVIAPLLALAMTTLAGPHLTAPIRESRIAGNLHRHFRTSEDSGLPQHRVPRLSAFARRILDILASAGSLVAATVAQLVLLGLVHAAAAHAISDRSIVHPLIETSLLGVALWFWLAIVAQRGAGRWRSLFALLLTGKLVCLMAAILVLAPRLLFTAQAHHTGGAALADQQLAGLLMLTACPLSYVLAGIVIAAQWLRELGTPDKHPSVPEATRLAG